jgi:hypothetical protein
MIESHTDIINYRLAGVAPELFTVAKGVKPDLVSAVSTFLRAAAAYRLPHQLNQQRSRQMLLVEEAAA